MRIDSFLYRLDINNWLEWKSVKASIEDINKMIHSNYHHIKPSDKVFKIDQTTMITFITYPKEKRKHISVFSTNDGKFLLVATNKIDDINQNHKDYMKHNLNIMFRMKREVSELLNKNINIENVYDLVITRGITKDYNEMMLYNLLNELMLITCNDIKHYTMALVTDKDGENKLEMTEKSNDVIHRMIKEIDHIIRKTESRIGCDVKDYSFNPIHIVRGKSNGSC